MENKPSGGRFIAALLFFATTAGIAILLLLTALVIWLSSVTGSFIASALIAGGFFAVLALLVYLFAIRDAVEQIRRQAETVYEVAHAAQTGYEWLAGKVSLFLKLREELQKKWKKAGAASCSGFFRPSAKGCAAISARTLAERAFRTCSELRFRFQRFVFRPNVIRPGRKIQTYSRSGRTMSGQKSPVKSKPT